MTRSCPCLDMIEDVGFLCDSKTFCFETQAGPSSKKKFSVVIIAAQGGTVRNGDVKFVPVGDHQQGS